MSDIAIRVDNLSKCYRIALSASRHDTLRDLIVDFATAPVKNLIQLKKLTSFNDQAEQADVIWALKNVSFEVMQGEVLGIIGKNGAGKSTLLKILSRITDPTAGKVELYGRLSSLLEVGVGFHPELSGRENIFLNGSILGMRKSEITSKFDEIVSFAEMEKFIDTPVKRYSSGMYVRLAFAVAAYLEPEILLVDEVLAVGDIAFQRKCLGKMDEVAKGGRTVIFVSHNMGAIQSLCKTALWIDAGQIEKIGPVNDVIDSYQYKYIGNQDSSNCIVERQATEVNSLKFYFKRVTMQNMQGQDKNEFKYNDTLILLIDFYGEPETDFSPEFRMYNELGQLVTTGSAAAFHGKYFDRGTKRVKIVINRLPLTSGKYTLALSIALRDSRCDTWDNAIGFTIIRCQPFEMPYEMPTRIEGTCIIEHSFIKMA